MNEITKIHLGRQPFTISVEAHKDLRTYLGAIAVQVGASSDVLKEIEVRMAELLTERGINSDKVILPEDVTFLKEQLGEPRDFKEDSDEPEANAQPADDAGAPKRLFRDTENGMVAGVSSGLAVYFGIDAVIVRLIFIVITLMAGWGILLYIILWLIVPEAKTTSERLQMRGKAVTVDSLKEIVDRADFQGAAERANKTVGPFVESAAKTSGIVLLYILGWVFIAIAVMGLFALVAGGVYTMVNWGEALSPAYDLTKTDTILGFMGVVSAAIVLIFMMFIGAAMMQRKWKVPGWVTAALIGVFFITSSVGAALAPRAVHNIREHCTNQGCEWRDPNFKN